MGEPMGIKRRQVLFALLITICLAARGAAAADESLLSYVASDCHAAALIRPANFVDFQLGGKPLPLLELFGEYGNPAGFNPSVASLCDSLLVEFWLVAEDEVPEWAFVARFKQPYVRGDCCQAFLGASKRVDVLGFKGARGVKEGANAAVFLDEHTIAVGSDRRLKGMLDTTKTNGNVAKLLAQLEPTNEVRAAADLAACRESLHKWIPPELDDDPLSRVVQATKTIVDTAQSATLVIDLRKPSARSVFFATDEAQAEKLASSFDEYFAQLISMAVGPVQAEVDRKRKQLAPDELAKIETGIRSIKVLYSGMAPKRRGLMLTSEIDDVARFGAAISTFLPAVGGAYFGGMRAEATNRLLKISAALEKYRAQHGKYPEDICDADGKPLLSWRVVLLPYLGCEELYKQFHLDERWGRSHNMNVAMSVPLVYQHPYAPMGTHGNCLRPTGDGTEFVGRENSHPACARGIVLLEARTPQSVIWSKPDDLAIDFARPMAGISGAMPYGTLAIDGTGKVHLLTPNMPPAELRRLLAGSGRPPIGSTK
ncbi:MAG: DUF1559 domain-containing protein [Pirellulales bacterium]